MSQPPNQASECSGTVWLASRDHETVSEKLLPEHSRRDLEIPPPPTKTGVPLTHVRVININSHATSLELQQIRNYSIQHVPHFSAGQVCALIRPVYTDHETYYQSNFIVKAQKEHIMQV